MEGEEIEVTQKSVTLALQEAEWMDKFNRHKALSMMATGSALGIVGFFIAAIGGYWNIFATNNLRSKLAGKFDSGEAYYPLTVSEMVSDPRSAAGKAFLAFEFCAAVFILGSWYPYELSNVYIGQRHKALRSWKGCPSWSTIRQFVPMIGLFLVAWVSTTPVTRMQPSDFVTNQIHILAATALFGGYILCEMVGLFVFHVHGEGGTIRGAVIIGCAICAVTTIVLQFTYPYAPASILPCQDEYTEYTIGNLTDRLAMKGSNGDPEVYLDARAYIESVSLAGGFSRSDPVTVLTNTAHGTCLFIKMLTFWSEVVAGVLGLGSHLIIWYYAPERKLKLGDDNDLLLGPGDYDSDSDGASGS